MDDQLEDRLPPREVAARSTLLDSLRGFALLGILLVNIEALSMPITVDFNYELTRFPGALDRAASFALLYLVDGKFILIFSFLFGYGFELQQAKAVRDGADFVERYRRRMWWLLGIGIAHGLLLFFGDILGMYALLGFVLLAFRDAGDRALLKATIVMWILSIFFYAMAGVASATLEPLSPAEVDDALRVHREGPFVDLLAFRTKDLVAQYGVVLVLGVQLLGAFFVGYVAARRGLLRDPVGERAFWIRVLKISLPIALVGNLAFPIVSSSLELSRDAVWMGLGFGARDLFTPFGAAVWIALFALLHAHEDWARRLAIFAPQGRMSLTAYVGQSLLCGFVLYHYGLGLYGDVGPAAGAALAVIVYILIAAFARVWLKRHPHGPLEALQQRVVYR